MNKLYLDSITEESRQLINDKIDFVYIKNAKIRTIHLLNGIDTVVIQGGDYFRGSDMVERLPDCNVVIIVDAGYSQYDYYYLSGIPLVISCSTTPTNYMIVFNHRANKDYGYRDKVMIKEYSEALKEKNDCSKDIYSSFVKGLEGGESSLIFKELKRQSHYHQEIFEELLKIKEYQKPLERDRNGILIPPNAYLGIST